MSWSIVFRTEPGTSVFYRILCGSVITSTSIVWGLTIGNYYGKFNSVREISSAWAGQDYGRAWLSGLWWEWAGCACGGWDCRRKHHLCQHLCVDKNAKYIIEAFQKQNTKGFRMISRKEGVLVRTWMIRKILRVMKPWGKQALLQTHFKNLKTKEK